MATVAKGRSGKTSQVHRVSPIKPGLKGARNWATAQVRAASYSRQGFWRLVISLTSIFLFIVIGALWLGGFFPNVIKASQDFTRKQFVAMGFTVDHVYVLGEGRLNERDVRAALGASEGDFLFDVDIHAAQARVEALNWVDQAVVRRLWPDRVVVQIIERRPYAMWQSNGVVRLVDIEGKTISVANPQDFPYLRLVVSRDAPVGVVDIETRLQQFPQIETRVSALVQMPSGRWDVTLNEGRMRVKLPMNDVNDAFQQLMDLQTQSQVLDRDIATIDLRLPDRITFLPGRTEPV